MAMSDELIESIFTKFTQMLKTRVEVNHSFIHLSQEALLSFLLAHAIVDVQNEFLNHLYIEYPISRRLGSRDKIDLFVSANSGYYFEIKYIRPIPSGATRPLPQHRGNLINDLGKLTILVPPESRKFLLLVADNKFIEHLVKKPGFPQKGSWKGRIREMITCETERSKVTYGTQDFEVDVTNKFKANLNGLHVLLFEVS